MRSQLTQSVRSLPIWIWHALAFGSLLGMQLGLALFREIPLVVSDESVYLAHARYLSGTAPMPTLYEATFFAFGYSLFLIPAFWLFDNPYTTYTASLIIGAFLMSTLYFSLYYVLASLLGVSSRLAMLVSFITCLYPPILLRSTFAMAESAYVPGFMLLIALFGTMLRHKSVRSAVAFGLLLGFMYTIHARSLPLLPITGVFLTFQGVTRSLPWKAVSAVALVSAAVLIATRAAIDRLQIAMGSEVLEVPVRPIIANLVSFQGLHDFSLKLNELALYAMQSTFGLFPIGVLAIGVILWQCRHSGLAPLVQDVPTATVCFFLLAWLATLGESAALHAAFTEQAHFMSARHIDGIMALFIALGLVAILRGRQLRSRRLYTVVIALVAVSTLAASYGLSVFLDIVYAPQSLGINPYAGIFGVSPLALFVASVVAAMGFILYSCARHRLRVVAVGTIVCLFVLTSIYSYFLAILPLQDRVSRSSSLASYIRTYVGDPPAIAYDTAYFNRLTYYTYEYLLPHTRFLPFDSAAGEKPPAAIVITSPRWPEAEGLGAQFWQAEPNVPTVGASQALWTLPGPLQTDLLQQVNYVNTVLGRYSLPAHSIETPLGTPVQPVWAVWQRSFYHPEDIASQARLVWFDADAALHVPTHTSTPEAILLNFINPAEVARPLHVAVNGQTVFADSIPSGNWCQMFPLAGAGADYAAVELSRPSRDLLIVQGITLLDHVPDLHGAPLAGGPMPAAAYRSRLELSAPRQPHVVVRGAMDLARVTITNAGDHAWPTECEIGNVPGVVRLGVLWFHKDESDRSLAARVAESRTPLPYALAPEGSLSLSVMLIPISDDGSLLPPGDYEVWIGPVQESVSWFFQHGDDVLRIPVRVER